MTHNEEIIRRLRQVPDLATWLNAAVPCYFQDSAGRILGLRLTPSGRIRSLDQLVEFVELEYLSVKGLGITDASVLAQLPMLRWIDLSQNQLEDISFCLSLERLEYLNVAINRIARLPNAIAEKHPRLRLGWVDQQEGRGLVLRGNTTLVHPPVEIAKRGDEAIRSYLAANHRAGPLTAEQARLLVLGPASSGKSSLVTALRQIAASANSHTAGMLSRVRVVEVSGRADVEASLAVYRDTERLPMLLVLPAGSSDHDATQFLRTISIVVPGAQVVVVTTRVAGERVRGRLNGPLLMERFSPVADFLEADLSRANDPGLEQIADQVARMVSETPGFSVEITDECRSIIDTVGARRSPAALVADFIGREADNASAVVDLLRYIGEIVHRDSFALENFAVVHPEWLLGWISDPPIQIHADHRAISARRVASSLRAAVEASWPEFVQDSHVRYLFDVLVQIGVVVRLLPGDQVIVPHALPLEPPERAQAVATESVSSCVLAFANDEPDAAAEGGSETLRTTMHRGVAALRRLSPDALYWRDGVVVTPPNGSDVVITTVGDEVQINGRSETDVAHVAHGLVGASPGLIWKDMPRSSPATTRPERTLVRATCFLSYSRTDFLAAVEFIGQLEQLGVEALWDRGGEVQDRTARFATAIQRDIERSHLLIVLLSNTSAESRWVGEEVAFAEARGVDVAYIELPELDPRALPLGMQTVNRLNGWSETVEISRAAVQVLYLLSNKT